MTEEEKKAIESLKNRLEILHNNTQWATENSIKVALNLIDKQQKEIEYYKSELEKESSIWTKIEKGNDYISKDKIKDKMKELEEKEKNCNFTGLITECEIKIETLKELL